MWLEGVPVVTMKKNDRTETDVVLHWVDGDTGSGFFQYSQSVWVTFEVGECRSTVNMTCLVDETFQIHVTMVDRSSW